MRKKSDRNEKRLLANSENLNQSECFKLIQELVQPGFGRMTRYFCQLLNVSRSGYYNYLSSTDSRQKRVQMDEQAGILIKKAFNRRGYKKGSRSIKMTLENEYKTCYNLKRIRRLMKKINLVCPHRKANPYRRMAKATQQHRTLPNTLQRDFKFFGLMKDHVSSHSCTTLAELQQEINRYIRYSNYHRYQWGLKR